MRAAALAGAAAPNQTAGNIGTPVEGAQYLHLEEIQFLTSDAEMLSLCRLLNLGANEKSQFVLFAILRGECDLRTARS